VGAAMLSRRRLLKAGGGLIVGFSLDLALPGLAAAQSPPSIASGKTLAGDAVDAFIAIHADGSASVYTGKVDLGTGLRIAMRQMAGEELGLRVDRIALIEGDTALTPDQGPTAGSTGIARGGVQVRQAAATARQAVIRMAAARLGRGETGLDLSDGAVRDESGAAVAHLGEIIGEKRFDLNLDPAAPLRAPARYKIVGQKLPRPDLPAKITGRHAYVHDFTLPHMLHGRVIRPSAIGAKLQSVDDGSVAHLTGVRIVRIENFLGIVAEDEWTAIRAARALKHEWSDGQGLGGHDGVFAAMRSTPPVRDEVLVSRGDAPGGLTGARRVLRASYGWPVQSHASLGPSCAVADVRPDGATIWTASQATHRYWPVFAEFLRLPKEKVRLVYLDGSGCYGMNGHDDAAADAALLSQATGRPVRVQWMREDEHGWDPKGPPQLLDLAASLDEKGRLAAWTTEAWLPEATAKLPFIPLLGPSAAGLAQPIGESVGLISQNAYPPYAVENLQAVVHWLKEAPLRPSNIRAPGKIANCFAVESFIDELASAAGADPLEFRLAGLNDPRGVEVLKRVATRMGWQAHPAGARAETGGLARGRGLAYVHYKFAENYVAMGMEVTVERSTGRIAVERVACAHDCGLIINPDALANQVEGNIVQTLSRTLHEEVTFDRARVTSTDWASYPILRISEAPDIELDLVDRRSEPPWGAGEAASAPVAAALGNAVFDAIGIRLRQVPFTAERVKAAIRAQQT
jgi:nicotinate dehydrogenase subunit B